MGILTWALLMSWASQARVAPTLAVGEPERALSLLTWVFGYNSPTTISNENLIAIANTYIVFEAQLLVVIIVAEIVVKSLYKLF